MSETATDEVITIDLPVLDEVGRAALFTEARTANPFSDTPVSDAELSGIWQLAKWPPTSANTQPLRVLYVRTPQARERLISLMSDGNKEKTRSAPAIAVLAADLDFHEHIPDLFPVMPGLRGTFAADETVRHGMARSNAWLQAGYFLLAVRAMGLAAGPMGGFDHAGVDKEFFPGGRFASLVVVNMGHPGPGAWFPRLPRLDDDAVLQWA